jgi:hypothetical protein
MEYSCPPSSLTCFPSSLYTFSLIHISFSILIHLLYDPLHNLSLSPVTLIICLDRSPFQPHTHNHATIPPYIHRHTGIDGTYLISPPHPHTSRRLRLVLILASRYVAIAKHPPDQIAQRGTHTVLP